MAYLTCKNLTLGYEGHAIVSDLNFKVGKGDYLCIVGENGTGKKYIDQNTSSSTGCDQWRSDGW